MCHACYKKSLHLLISDWSKITYFIQRLIMGKIRD